MTKSLKKFLLDQGVKHMARGPQQARYGVHFGPLYEFKKVKKKSREWER